MKTYFILLFSLFFSFEVFSQNSKKSVVTVPDAVSAAFTQKYPDASVPTWKKDSAYTVTFISDEMTGKAEFATNGTWHFTKYSIPEKELPSTIINDLKQNYRTYKVKFSEMVQEPSVNDYYYLFAKSDGIGQPTVKLYYTLTGKLIRKISSENKQINSVPEIIVDTNTPSDSTVIETSEEKISSKELPSLVMSYIKREYYGYNIKEAVISTTGKKSFYHVKVKKEAQKAVIELVFDIKGKYIEQKKGD